MVHKGFVEGHRAFVCSEHKDGVRVFMLYRHYKVLELQGIKEVEKNE